MSAKTAFLAVAIALVGLVLGGCATAPLTQTTTLKNPKTGKTVTCGGKQAAPSFWHGAFGYKVAQRHKKQCVEEHERKGFKKAG